MQAKTFNELYVALVKLKMNLLATDIFDNVDILMDAGKAYQVDLRLAPFSSKDDINVIAKMDLKEKKIRIGAQGSLSNTEDVELVTAWSLLHT